MLGLGRFTMVLVLLAGCARGARPGPEEGRAERGGERAAPSQQDLAPIEQINTWLDGMHVMKYDPDHVMEAHHYCARVDSELTQCALYDGSDRRARLVGVEYVISERAFRGLPEAEQKYWHPHNYEVLTGLLVAPGLKPKADKQLARELLNTYGKTWQTWDTGAVGARSDRLPMGDPALAWSFNADNEVPPALVDARNRRLDVDGQALRKERMALVPDARPQEGVNALASHFPMRRPVPGVWEAGPMLRIRPASR